jgi:hypothetical protein
MEFRNGEILLDQQTPKKLFWKLLNQSEQFSELTEQKMLYTEVIQNHQRKENLIFSSGKIKLWNQQQF